ncbi:hypothetical protein BJ170DRAFT_701209 [Xylariales sp. AK1849]|nr:hypothetical protein BJ170DRAFT_701209 [Xylariales sp. AK1849]
MASYSLPYYANPATIPAQLPTIEEIGAAQGILSDKLVTKVVSIGDPFVVKYGPQVDLLEGEAMLFFTKLLVCSSTAYIRTLWSPNNEIKIIVMERIKGQDLSLIWAKLDHAAKETLAIKFRSIFTDVGHRGLPDGIFWTNDALHPFAGPFETESDLNKAMVAKYVEDRLSKHKAENYTRTFKDVLQNHPPVFTHADFQRKNNWKFVIIDWEFGGWYLSYWAYARTIFVCGGWEDGWSLWVDGSLEPFWNEYVWMNMFFL